MSVAEIASGPSRQERAESSGLAWAFVFSITLHLLIFGGYQAGKKFNLWETLHWPSWLRPVKQLVEALKPKPVSPAQQPREAPLLFVEVNPALAAPEPPKNAQYYSSHNAQAANSEANQDT